ncbi:MAG: 30S ribosomal protein S19 [Candidatus Aenigmarchaeota archaeon]|nr:30S ribosomal protein S19 [Candidatus Aenigmarchaeota archaeon]
MAKKFLFKGRTTEELQAMNMEEFSKVVDSRARRALLRGYTKHEKKLIEDIRKNDGKLVRTQCRDMVIMPEMVGVKIAVHNGKEFVAIDIKTEMLGRRLGEFALTRGRVKHSSPGIGATRSSKAVSLK